MLLHIYIYIENSVSVDQNDVLIVMFVSFFTELLIYKEDQVCQKTVKKSAA